MNDSEYYSLPYISSSALGWFEQSPLYCFKRLNNELEDEDSSYLTLGRQIHMRILEPEEFRQTYTYLDFNTPTSKNQLEFSKRFADMTKLGVSREEALTTAYLESYSTKNTSAKTILINAEQLYEGLEQFISYLLIQDKYKDVLSSSKQNVIESAYEALHNHKKASVLLFNDELIADGNVNSYNELAILWDFPIYINGKTAVKCKSKLDRLVIDHKNKKITLIDLKSTGGFSLFKETFEKRNLYRQLSFYWLAVQQFFKEQFKDKDFEEYEKETYLAIVTTNPNYTESKVIRVSQEDLDDKLVEITNLMTKISWHVLTGNWEHSREYYDSDGVETL